VDLIYARLMANWNILRKISWPTTLHTAWGRVDGKRGNIRSIPASIHLGGAHAEIVSRARLRFWWRRRSTGRIYRERRDLSSVTGSNEDEDENEDEED